MKHRISPGDRTFRAEFEACTYPPARFDHRAHIRLAYTCLCEQDTDSAYESVRRALQSFLRHHGVEISKYHDTITRAWVMAVRHFMEITPDAASADDFIEQNPRMLDAKLMLTHYSAEVLFSDEARKRFVEPDLDPIPRYEAQLDECVAGPFDGGCACRFVRYRMESTPLFVHCCHCRSCQRETGASFALNALIESERVQLLQGEINVVITPSASGKGQKIARCPRCQVAVWSNYAGAGDAIRFIRVGTLDQPERFPPDIHIYTSSKQPWVLLPPGQPAVSEYYRASEHWPEESLERRAALLKTPGTMR